MADTPEIEQEPRAAEAQSAPAAVQTPPAERPERKPGPQGDRPPGDRPQGGRGPQGQGREGGGQRREGGPGQGNREGRGGPHGGREGGRGERGDDRRDDRRGGDRGRFEGPPEIDIEKLISDPLYLDNQAHGVVSRMRDMDSGTKSQLRRLYNAVRRAVRTPENERQQQFVMLRARLAYTIARHSLRSLDPLEKLLLQVTRKNEARGYERFRDLFEAIVAYNE
ncbi:MAG TPA: type III-A CRISPR-associated protein Csm2 [Bryobacteraceae bacterium]|jgi:CRISPR type III-A-associated protein Csm2|nr:type III-A CRISPR-associated protein Csm2 [Bryobacteraceae bacterium]